MRLSRKFTSKNLQSSPESEIVKNMPRIATRAHRTTKKRAADYEESSDDESLRSRATRGKQSKRTLPKTPSKPAVVHSDDSDVHEDVTEELLSDVEAVDGVLTMDVDVVDDSGKKTGLQTLTVPVVKLKIPESNASTKRSTRASDGKKSLEDEDDDSDDGLAEAKTPPRGRNARGRKPKGNSTVTNGKNSGQDHEVSDDTESESDEEFTVKRLGKSRTVKQSIVSKSKELKEIAIDVNDKSKSATSKLRANRNRPTVVSVDDDDSNFNTTGKVRHSVRVVAPRKYAIESDSDSGKAKHSSSDNDLSGESDDSDSDYKEKSKPTMKSRAYKSRYTPKKGQRNAKKTSAAQGKASSSSIEIDEEYEELKKELIERQILGLDHDIYIKKLDALQKERALKLPPSEFTIDLINRKERNE